MVFATPDMFEDGAGAALESSLVDGAATRIEHLTSIVAGAEAIAAFEPIWRRLASVSRHQAVFQGYGFAIAAARYHEERGERVFAVVATWEGRPACILPIAIKRRGGVSVGRFLGDPLSQYGDALLASAAPSRTVELALKRLAGQAGIDVFEFRRVRDDAAIAPALRTFGRQVGAAIEAPHAEFSTEESSDDFLLRVAGPKQKRERSRSRRRLQERGALVFEMLRGEAAIGPLRHAFELKRAWLAHQGDASPVIDDARALSALAGFASDAEDGDGLVVGRLSVDGAPAAYEVGIVRGRRFHAYLGAVSEDFACASPGKIVMAETLAWCRKNGVDVYDLLPPGDAYKRRWSNGSMTVRNYVAPMTVIGRVYSGLWLDEIRPRLRSALGAMPASLRRRLGGAALKAAAFSQARSRDAELLLKARR